MKVLSNIKRLYQLFFVLILFSLSQLITSARQVHQYPFRPTDCSSTSISSELLPFFEPSDLVWDSERKALWTVSDSGHLALLNDQGKLLELIEVNEFNGKKIDLEGITIIPGRSQYLYIGQEDPPSIVEYHLPTYSLTRSFPLPFFTSSAIKKNKGLESLLYLPFSSSPIPNEMVFLAGRQSDGHIGVYSIPINANSTINLKRNVKNKKGNDDHDEQEEETEGEIAHLLGWIIPPGPANDLSALTIHDQHIYFLWDKPKTMTSIRLNYLTSLIVESISKENSKTPFLHELSHEKDQIWNYDKRGQEGIAFGNDYFFIAIDPPKHQGDKGIDRYEIWKLNCFLLRSNNNNNDETEKD